jgi:hypothetical protein
VADPHTNEIEEFYHGLGLRTISTYDRQAVLDSIRESRRRYAHVDQSQSLEKTAGMFHEQLRKELGEDPAAVDVLLHVATMLGSLAALGVSGQNLLNVIAYLADDMARGGDGS